MNKNSSLQILQDLQIPWNSIWKNSNKNRNIAWDNKSHWPVVMTNLHILSKANVSGKGTFHQKCCILVGSNLLIFYVSIPEYCNQ